MSIAVVNLKGQVVFLSNANVFAEALALNLVEGLLCAEKIKAGLANRHDPGFASKTSNGIEGSGEFTTLMKPRRFIGVKGHSSEDSGLAGRECHRPLGCLNIGTHLDHTRNPDSFCPIEVLPVIHRVLAISKFEVSVIVIDRDLEGLWFWRIGQSSIACL
jgi:hypothetical protein